MALQFLKAPRSLSQDITSALGGSLEALTQNKLKEIEHGQRLRGLHALGLPPEAAGLPDTLLSAELNRRNQAQNIRLKHDLKQQREDEIARMLNGEEGYASQNQPQPEPRGPQGSPSLTQEQYQQLQSARPDLMFNPPSQQQNQVPQQAQPPVQRTSNATAPMARQIPYGLPANVHNQYKMRLEREQAQANATNKKWIDTLDSDIKIAKEMGDLVDEMQQLLSTGKVATDAQGRFKPGIFQNYETQTFGAKSNELAGLLASKRGGRLTAFGLKLARESKPNIEHKLRTQRRLLDDINKSVQNVNNTRDVFDQIVAENSGYQPANISTLVRDRLKNYKPQENNEGENNTRAPFEPQQSQERGEAPVGTIARNIAGLGKSALSSAANQIGDALSSGFGGLNYATTPFAEEQLGNEQSKEAENARNTFRQLNKESLHLPQIPTYEEIQEHLPVSFPTSEQANNYIDKVTGGYTKPRNEWEQSLQNIGSVFGSLAGPGFLNKFTKGLSTWLSPKAASVVEKGSKLIMPFQGVSWQKSLAAGALSEAGGRAVEFAGGGPLQQALARISLGSLAVGWGGAHEIDQNIKEAYKASGPAGDSIYKQLNPVVHELEAFEKSVPHAAPYKKIAKDIVKDTVKSLKEGSKGGNVIKINKPIKTGPRKLTIQEYNSATPTKGPQTTSRTPREVSASTLVKTKQATNEWHGLSIDPKEPGGKHLPKGARKYVDAVTNILNKHIEPLALEHPEFGKPYALAEDMYRAKSDANYVNKSMKDWKDYYAGPTTAGLATWAARGLGKWTVGEGARIFQLVWKHPVTRSIYLKALGHAARGNLSALNKSLHELDEAGELIHQK